MLTPIESEAALRSGSVAAATTRDVVVVDGPEAAIYLHGQVSQNIEGMAVGASAWTLLLEPVGRVTAWARASRVSDEQFWLDVDSGTGEAMLARLERFKLRTKATFELRAGVATTALRGPDVSTPDELRVALAALDHAAVVAPVAWPKSSGVDLLGIGASPAAELLGVALGDPSIVELERIESGRPAMGRELLRRRFPPRPVWSTTPLTSPRAATSARNSWLASTLGATTRPGLCIRLRSRPLTPLQMGQR